METWKDIPGYEDRYQVSDEGRVRSVDRMARGVSKAGRDYLKKMPGRVLRPGNCRGYLIVNLHPTGTVTVHRLVALAFVSGFAAGLEVNHKDGNKKNNAASNLEWVTRQGNQVHAVVAGLNSQAVPVKHPTTGQVFPSIAQAARHAGRRHRTIAKEWARA